LLNIKKNQHSLSDKAKMNKAKLLTDILCPSSESIKQVSIRLRSMIKWLDLWAMVEQWMSFTSTLARLLILPQYPCIQVWTLQSGWVNYQMDKKLVECLSSEGNWLMGSREYV